MIWDLNKVIIIKVIIINVLNVCLKNLNLTCLITYKTEENGVINNKNRLNTVPVNYFQIFSYLNVVKCYVGPVHTCPDIFDSPTFSFTIQKLPVYT